jgi:thiol:disulfide interchange protein DsbD
MMITRRIGRIAFAGVAWLCAMTAHASDLLDPQEAFRFSAALGDGGKSIEAHFGAADGYYLYRDRLAFTASGGVKLGDAQYPAGEVKFDETFNRKLVVYRGDVIVRLPVQSGDGTFTLTARLQGCADQGVCYPPEVRTTQLVLGTPADPGQAVPGATFASSSVSVPTGDHSIASALHSRSLTTLVPVFLVLGLLLSFTPCVLPMLPIVSSIIVGERAPARDGNARGSIGSRGFVLALAYASGMTIVYTAFGVAAGLAGEGLAAVLQKPWIITLFAALLVALALSMFGFYELQLPASWQTRLARVSNNRSAGKLAGTFAMGAISALIVGPCVAAPLAGALLYISETRDVVVGGSALFALAAGMSVPLLLLGAGAGWLLPRAGRWMESVKRVFGVLLIAVALWTLLPLVSSTPQAQAWTRIQSVEQLDDALAHANGTPLLLDFYADWCVSCKEMERFTFSDPRVAASFTSFRLLRVDVTANNDCDKALLKRFRLFGPPATIFFDDQGREVPGARVIGFERADPFLQRLQSIDGRGQPGRG